jgi:hypothetical protein
MAPGMHRRPASPYNYQKRKSGSPLYKLDKSGKTGVSTENKQIEALEWLKHRENWNIWYCIPV